MFPASVSKTPPGPDPLACAVFLVLSFAIAGIVHTLWLRSRLSQRFAVPLDAGRCFRGKRIFGANKMVRGFMVMGPAAAASFVLVFLTLGTVAPEVARSLWPLSPVEYAAIGFIAGLGFMAGELPNSFIKRQLDIVPGRPAGKLVFRLIFSCIDRLDSTAGLLLAVSAAVTVPGWAYVYVIVSGVGLHWAFSVLLFAVGVKERMA